MFGFYLFFFFLFILLIIFVYKFFSNIEKLVDIYIFKHKKCFLLTNNKEENLKECIFLFEIKDDIEKKEKCLIKVYNRYGFSKYYVVEKNKIIM